ncbi:hypothetical protein [Achromobacter marplatensis]
MRQAILRQASLRRACCPRGAPGSASRAPGRRCSGSTAPRLRQESAAA